MARINIIDKTTDQIIANCDEQELQGSIITTHYGGFEQVYCIEQEFYIKQEEVKENGGLSEVSGRSE